MNRVGTDVVESGFAADVIIGGDNSFFGRGKWGCYRKAMGRWSAGSKRFERSLIEDRYGPVASDARQEMIPRRARLKQCLELSGDGGASPSWSLLIAAQASIRDTYFIALSGTSRLEDALDERLLEVAGVLGEEGADLLGGFLRWLGGELLDGGDM